MNFSFSTNNYSIPHFTGQHFGVILRIGTRICAIHILSWIKGAGKRQEAGGNRMARPSKNIIEYRIYELEPDKPFLCLSGE